MTAPALQIAGVKTSTSKLRERRNSRRNRELEGCLLAARQRTTATKMVPVLDELEGDEPPMAKGARAHQTKDSRHEITRA